MSYPRRESGTIEISALAPSTCDPSPVSPCQAVRKLNSGRRDLCSERESRSVQYNKYMDRASERSRGEIERESTAATGIEAKACRQRQTTTILDKVKVMGKSATWRQRVLKIPNADQSNS